MKSRHWVTLLSLAAAAILLALRRNWFPNGDATPRWFWDGAYWVLLVVAGAALLVSTMSSLVEPPSGSSIPVRKFW